MSDLPGPTEPGPERSSGIGRASALLASGTLVSRLLGFVRAIVLTATLGAVASAAGDAFALANQLPNNIYALVAGGVLGAILVPQIVRASVQDDGGQGYINKIVTIGGVAFFGLAVLATVAAPLLVSLYVQPGTDGSGFSPEGIALATAFAYWCLPQVLFYALYSLLGEVLNARRVFGPFTWAPVVNNLIAIGGLLAFALVFGGSGANSDVEVWDASRIALLGGSATLGVASQAIVLAVFWKRTGLAYRPDFHWKGVGLRRTGQAAGWVFGMILLGQVVGIFQSRVASEAAGEGASLLALQNSWLIFMLPHSVIAVSVGTAYFTRMSGHASSKNLAGLRDDVSSSVRNIGLLITLASAILVVVAFPFARVFETQFDNVTAMAIVIIAFVLGLVPFSAFFVLQRAYYSLDDTRTPFLIEVVRSALAIVGVLLCSLLPVDRIAAGIALVTTVIGLTQTIAAFALLRRRLGPLGGRLLLGRHLQFALAAIVSAVVGAGILFALGGVTPNGFAQESRVSAIISIGTIGAGMATVYLGMLLLVRNPETRTAVGAVTARFGRKA
ncbi:MAG: mviN [Microbacteriaceae bacterium]|nr:mviN [Microbacteriaceae bacterium]